MNSNKQRNIRIISENKIQKTSNLNNNIESEIKKEEKIKNLYVNYVEKYILHIQLYIIIQNKNIIL